MSDAKNIIERLKLIANSKTNTDLAEKLNTNESTIRSWARRGNVPLEKCLLASKEFNASVEWILTGEGSQATNQVTGNVSIDEIKNSLMEGLFTAIQVRAITLADDAKIGLVADILIKEITENHQLVFSDTENREAKHG